MTFALKMNSSKTIFLLAIVALIMLFVYPIQSIPINDDSVKLPMRHKRWTFNTWRLHGRRQLPNDFYFPKTSPLNDEHHYERFNNNNNNDNDMTLTFDEDLPQFFKNYNRQ